MKKVTMIGLVAVVLATACGGTSDSEPESVVDGAATADNDVNAANEGEQSTATNGEDGSNEVVDAEDTANAPDTDGDQVNGETPVPGTGDSPSTAPADDEAAGEPPPPIVAHPNVQVATAMTDLVDRIGASADAIEVVSVQEVTWADGSIGCPEPGMRYTQAIVNGTRIVLRVSGADYEYHSGGGREVFYCKNPSDPVPGGYGDV